MSTVKISAFINPTTEISKKLLIVGRGNVPVVLTTIGTLSDSENIEIQRPLYVGDVDIDDDSAWVCIEADGIQATLSSGHDQLAVMNGIYRIYKPVTANSVGVGVGYDPYI